MFALIIGIDKYRHSLNLQSEVSDNLPGASTRDTTKIARDSSLTGAVADADAFRDYLYNHLHVPPAQVRNLRNEKATRNAIIQALHDMAKDPDIKLNNPIVIYYAGHGATGVAPRNWHYDNSDIQLLIPYDFSAAVNVDSSIGAEHVIHGIPDRTLRSLLGRLAAAKGDNIVRSQ